MFILLVMFHIVQKVVKHRLVYLHALLIIMLQGICIQDFSHIIKSSVW